MKELYLSNSIENLNEFVQKSFKNVKAYNAFRLYSSADKIFKRGMELLLKEGDEEKAYVLFVRFILLYEFLESKTDQRFTKVRLGTEYKEVTEQLERLKSSLQDRYVKQKNTETLSPKVIEEQGAKLKLNPQTVSVDLKDPAISFSNGYISCNELYDLLQKKIDIVILDARPRDDFLKSNMKHPNCVNIPEEKIDSGLSANTLGKHVPNESKTQWDRRWKATLTILLDWSSTKETITASKLSVLKDIFINWDTTMKNSNLPVILNGGYLEWLQMYPMLCTNHNVVYAVQNSVLNDLLDLDSIEYPTAEETTRYLKPPSLQPVINRATKPVITQDTAQPKVLINENRDQSFDLKEVQYNQNLEEVSDPKKNETEVEVGLPSPQEDKGSVENNNKPEPNKESEELKKKLQNIADIQASTPKPSEITGEIVAREDLDIREKLLQEAREKKKIFIVEPKTIPVDKKPTEPSFPMIDRRSKPSMKPQIVQPGLTGLKNFGATCYMNAVVQCYSNTRMLHNFFVYGVYPDNRASDESYGAVSKPFRDLLVKLWSGQYRTFLPKEFKVIVNTYGPRYKSRDHQDAHEFLISLNTWLHDDLKRDAIRPLQVCWTPKERNWIKCTDGKHSIILDTFCGQQLTVINCDECDKRKEKLEIFENLSLALPSRDRCTLEECLKSFFSRQHIQDYKCQTCNSNKVVHMQVKLVGHPAVLVLSLKRFAELYINNTLSFVKNDVGVQYPIENLKINSMIYNLYGVIVHRGQLDMGHYFAVIKNVRNGRWYRYDDSSVTEVDRQSAIEPNDAYMLFYQLEEEELLAKQQFGY